MYANSAKNWSKITSKACSTSVTAGLLPVNTRLYMIRQGRQRPEILPWFQLPCVLYMQQQRLCASGQGGGSRRQSIAQHCDTSPQPSTNTNIPVATSQPYWQSRAEEQDHLCSFCRPVTDAADRLSEQSQTSVLWFDTGVNMTQYHYLHFALKQLLTRISLVIFNFSVSASLNYKDFVVFCSLNYEAAYEITFLFQKMMVYYKKSLQRKKLGIRTLCSSINGATLLH